MKKINIAKYVKLVVLGSLLTTLFIPNKVVASEEELTSSTPVTTQETSIIQETTGMSELEMTGTTESHLSSNEPVMQRVALPPIVYQNLDLEFQEKDYGLYNNPEFLEGALKLDSTDNYLGKQVKAIAYYKLPTGEIYYNYKLGSHYYWTDAKAFKKFEAIIEMKSSKESLEFIDGSYGLYNTPESLMGAIQLDSISKYLNVGVTAGAIYTTSDGEQHYNFKLGNRYYWANAKAFKKWPTITVMAATKDSLEFINGDYGLYNTPESLFGANKLDSVSNYLTKSVTAGAIYTTSDGEQHYNFKLGNRYYWANAKAFKKWPVITEMKAVNLSVGISDISYGFYNTPESLHGAIKIGTADGNYNKNVTIGAIYTTSDGQQHYNFKLGDRYYWANSKAFTPVNKLIKREYLTQKLKFTNSEYDLSNIPYRIEVNYQALGRTSEHINKTVTAIALFTTDDGEQYYNYRLGERYYWTNAKAFNKSITITDIKYMSKKVKFDRNHYALLNTPSGTDGAITLGMSNNHIGQVVTAIAIATTDDGLQHYNYKLGNRYYWTAVGAFKPAVSPDAIVNIAAKYVGIRSNPPRSNLFTKAYWGQNFNGSFSSDYDWCSVFIWYVFREAGAVDSFYNGAKSNTSFFSKYPERYPETVRQWQIEQGNYFTDTSKVKKGDLVFFDWKRPIRTAEHVAICGGYDSSGRMILYDGNWGDGVTRRALGPFESSRVSVLGYASPY